MAKFVGAVLSCEICGQSFKVPKCRANTARYCGHECSVIGRAKQTSLPKVAVVCKGCGKTFYEHRSHAERRVYCSRVCMERHPDHIKNKTERNKGENNAMWAGGICTHTDGYIYEKCDGHPYSNRGYVLQHRLVAERYLREHNPESKYLTQLGGQLYLKQGAVVHHVDGIRNNNVAENLQVMSIGEHISLHNAIRRNKKLGGKQ